MNLRIIERKLPFPISHHFDFVILATERVRIAHRNQLKNITFTFFNISKVVYRD